MRILHVCPGLAPVESSDRARYVWRLARQHAEIQSAAIFTTRVDPEAPTGRPVIERREGVTICWVNVPETSFERLEDSYINEQIEAAFRQFIHEMRSDVVHIHGLERLSVGLVDIVHSKDIRSIFTPHTSWETCPIESRRCRTDGLICSSVDTSKCGQCVYGSRWSDLLEGEEQERAAARGARSWESAYQSLYADRFESTRGWFARRPRAKAFALRKLPAEVRRRWREQTDELRWDPVERRKRRIGERLRTMDLITAPSSLMRDDWIAHFGLDARRVVTRPLPSPTSPSDVPPASRGPVTRIASWGTIDDDPGLRTLVASCCEVLGRGIQLELHLIGSVTSEDAVAWILAQFDQCGHPSNVIVGAQPADVDLETTLGAFDLVVEPRVTFDAPSAALLHAAERGTAVLVARGAVAPDFTTEFGFGASFRADGADDLTQAIEVFCRVDDGEPGRPRGERRRLRSIEHEALDFVRIYHELLYKKLDVESEAAQGLSPETWK
jgi:hypothetical protein